VEGVHRIAVERRQQIRLYGWTGQHDLQKKTGELTRGAIAYAAKALGITEIPDLWPWSKDCDRRPDDPTRGEQITQLAKAGALIAAEIDRLLVLEENS
jgi:hypothetical protein